MAGNEAAAIGSMRSVVSAQHALRRIGGARRLRPTLPRLGALCPGSIVPFLSSDLTAAVAVLKSGFTVSCSAGDAAPAVGRYDCNGVPTAGGLYVTAVARQARRHRQPRLCDASHVGSIWENTADCRHGADESDLIAAPTAGHPPASAERIACTRHFLTMVAPPRWHDVTQPAGRRARARNAVHRRSLSG